MYIFVVDVASGGYWKQDEAESQCLAVEWCRSCDRDGYPFFEVSLNWGSSEFSATSGVEGPKLYPLCTVLQGLKPTCLG